MDNLTRREHVGKLARNKHIDKLTRAKMRLENKN